MTNQKSDIQNTNIEPKETLCFTCQHCTAASHPKFQTLNQTLPDGRVSYQTSCPWAHDAQPVPGWTAKPTKLKITPDKTIDSYLVIACPFYAADLEAKVNELTNEQLKNLLYLPIRLVTTHRKLMIQLAIEYYKELKRLPEIERNTLKQAAPATIKPQFKFREALIARHKYYAEADIEMILEDANRENRPLSKQDERDKRVLEAEIKCCEEALKSLKRIEKRGFAEVRNPKEAD